MTAVRRGATAVVCVAIALGAPATALAGSACPDGTPSPQASPEDQKLALEVCKLNQDTSDLAQFRPWVPLAAVLVSLLAAGLGTHRYLSDRRRDRKLRIEDEISENLGRLNDAPESTTSASGRAVSALVHLSGLTAQKDAPAARNAEVTSALAEIVDHDLLDLDTPAKAHFPVICLEHWAPYAARFRDDQPACRELLRRYRAGLKRVRDDNGGYVNQVIRDDDGAYSAGNAPISEADRVLFATLVEGFAAHVDQLQDGARQQVIAEFETVVNAQVRSSLFPT